MFILTDSQEIDLTISPKTSKGNPAPIDGTATWESSDPSVVALDVAPDGLSAIAYAVGPLGTAQVSVTADVDTDEGVKLLTGVETIEVRAGQAVTLGIQAGEPRERPVPEPEPEPTPEPEPAPDVEP